MLTENDAVNDRGSWLSEMVLRNPVAVALIQLIVTELYLSACLIFDWGAGTIRGLILAGMLAGLVALRVAPGRASVHQSRHRPWLPPSTTYILVGIAAISVLATAGYAVVSSLRSNQIPMDQGQATWRAARLLWHGENPYGRGAMVDYFNYAIRADVRGRQGVISALPAENIEPSLAAYDRTLAPELRDELLAIPAGLASDPMHDESRLVGYKYGPLLIDVTALFVPLGVPAAVVILNAAACSAMFWAMGRLMLGMATAGAFGILALLLDPHIRFDFLINTATDVWALAFGALGVLACSRGKPMTTAAMLAFAVGCKIFPSLILLPLLLKFRGLRPVLVAAGIIALIYAPWVVWDPFGIIDNVFLWPLLMFKDTTSWLYFVPAWVAFLARACALAGIAFLWFRYLTGREPRLFWTLAMVNTILLGAGGVFHNNYIPWASIWIIAAIIENAARHDEAAAEPPALPRM